MGNRLDHLTKVAGNKKYDSELELLKSEKNTATKAVSYYLKKANGVKLDEATKKKIRSGAIDYRTYSSKNDEKYKNSILGQVTSVNEVLNAINAKVQSMQTNSDKQSTQVNEGAKTDTALPAKNENTGSNNSNNSNNSNQPAKKNTGSKQGNSKVEVGDKVTFVSGSYTGNSSGGGGAGNQNRGKVNGSYAADRHTLQI